MNSWAPIDGGPQCSGKPGCAWNLSMNVWERTPLRFEFLEDWSLPISPAYLAEAKRQTVVVDGKLCSATKTVYDYSKRTRCHSAAACSEFEPCLLAVGDHLGYRFELTEATFDPVHSRTKPLTVAFTIVNRGFSAMHNPRPVYIVLISSANELVFRSPVDASPGDWVSLRLASSMSCRACWSGSRTVSSAATIRSWRPSVRPTRAQDQARDAGQRIAAGCGRLPPRSVAA